MIRRTLPRDRFMQQQQMRYRHSARLCILLLVAATVLVCTGCAIPKHAQTNHLPLQLDPARPILTLDPSAVWTHAFNELRQAGPDAITQLLHAPPLNRPAAPDDLDVIVAASLVRLLAHPATDPPRLSATCLETTLGILYFDFRVDGRRIGTLAGLRNPPPNRWTDLFPQDFDHTLAATVDPEGDRRALHAWWANVCRTGTQALASPLRPQTEHLWPVLRRRYADFWEYRPEPGTMRCVAPPRGGALFQFRTHDYNLVRATCVYLGSSRDSAIQRRLIELIGSVSPVESYNAMFALRHSPDPQIRGVLERHEARQSSEDPAPPSDKHDRPAGLRQTPIGV